MPRVELAAIFLCDICNKEFDVKETNATEYQNTKIQSVTCDIWYNGYFTAKYICSVCNGRIQKTIEELHPEKRFSCSTWEKRK